MDASRKARMWESSERMSESSAEFDQAYPVCFNARDSLNDSALTL